MTINGSAKVALYLLATLFAFHPTALHTAEASPADTTDYHVYSSTGEALSLDAILAATDTVEVVLIGEVHSDPAAKTLTDSLLKKVGDRQESATLSLEMMERDIQHVVEEYLADLITKEHFLQSARVGTGFESSYGPILERAKEQEWTVLAANAPRRYANLVAREGRDALHDLPEVTRNWLAPLPFAEASTRYRDQWMELMQEMAHGNEHPTEENDGEPHPHAEGLENMLDAQVLWDATMAHAIAQQLMHSPDAPVVHLSGSFHVDWQTGIAEHLQRYRPGTAVLSISIQPDESPSTFTDEHEERADFIILTDEANLPQQLF